MGLDEWLWTESCKVLFGRHEGSRSRGFASGWHLFHCLQEQNVTSTCSSRKGGDCAGATWQRKKSFRKRRKKRQTLDPLGSAFLPVGKSSLQQERPDYPKGGWKPLGESGQVFHGNLGKGSPTPRAREGEAPCHENGYRWSERWSSTPYPMRGNPA